MKEPILIIFALFILLGLSYGPLKNASLNNQQTSTRSPSSSIGEKDEIKDTETASIKDIQNTIRKTERSVLNLQEDIEEEIERRSRSPYYDKIRMSSLSGVRQTDPGKEYLQLYTNLDEDETVNITGWYLKSEVTGYFAVIGKASLLPFPFTNTESDIVLKQRDRVYLTKGFSPIGISFRTNKCTGFFEENRTFTPGLSRKCPRPIEEDLPRFSPIHDRDDECVEIIERIPRCTTRGSEFLRDLPDTVPSSCKTYIKEQINYNTCVANHFSDTDFPGNEYRVYLKRFGPLWREKNEKISLYDRNGLVVDSIDY